VECRARSKTPGSVRVGHTGRLVDRVDLFGVAQGRLDGVCFDAMVPQGLDCQRSGD